MTPTTLPWGKATRLTLAGGLAFWAANVAISLTPIAAAYRAALSISLWPMTVAALAGGLLIAAGVSLVLLRFQDRIPGRSPILKALILSFLAMGVIEAFSIGVDGSRLSIYHLIGAGMNVPRFLALGAAIGWRFGAITPLQRDPVDAIAGSAR